MRNEPVTSPAEHENPARGPRRPRPATTAPAPTAPRESARVSWSVTAPSQPEHARPGSDRPNFWLPIAAAGLCVLSAAAAIVSYAAQYRLVYAARHLVVAALPEAAIPDVAALFACLGVALAVHGRRAIRARMLAALGGLALWLLRLSVAPRSTAAGFRQWVLEECPVAPGRRAPAPAGASVPGRPGDGRPGHRTTAGRTRPRQPGRARQIATRAGGLTRPSGGTSRLGAASVVGILEIAAGACVMGLFLFLRLCR
jgi:hypothetical protein